MIQTFEVWIKILIFAKSGKNTRIKRFFYNTQLRNKYGSAKPDNNNNTKFPLAKLKRMKSLSAQTSWSIKVGQ